ALRHRSGRRRFAAAVVFAARRVGSAGLVGARDPRMAVTPPAAGVTIAAHRRAAGACLKKAEMGLSVGIGLTNACDLACAHCYRDPARVNQLSVADVTTVWEALPVSSMNLGTGENGLHPRYEEIVAALAERGVKLSLTSNGFTIERSSDETLRRFSEVEVSIDFPT